MGAVILHQHEIAKFGVAVYVADTVPITDLDQLHESWLTGLVQKKSPSSIPKATSPLVKEPPHPSKVIKGGSLLIVVGTEAGKVQVLQWGCTGLLHVTHGGREHREEQRSNVATVLSSYGKLGEQKLVFVLIFSTLQAKS